MTTDIILEIKNSIQNALQSEFGLQKNLDEITLQPTLKDFEGSHTYIIFPLIKELKLKPEDIGKKIGDYLVQNKSIVQSYNIIKGFLNLSLSTNFWLQSLDSIFKNPNYGLSPQNGKKVMVEYSSPNTNKPLHLGHLRNNFLGDSISKIYESIGYEVIKANLVNDRGIHICKSMWAYQKFGNGETPETQNISGDKFVGNFYVLFDKKYKQEISNLINSGLDEETASKKAPCILEAQELLKKWENGDAETISLWKKMNQWVYKGFDKTYQKIGVSFHKIYYESETYILGKDIVKEGLQKKVFYKKDDNSVWVDLTEFGLDEKIVLRSDGTSVYITQDLGTCDKKFKDFNMQKSIYVVGNEQDYHFKVLFAIMKKLGRYYADELHHLSYGMVELPTGKMKSREGTVVDADDLIELMIIKAKEQTEALGKIDIENKNSFNELTRTIGIGALKFFLLKVDPKKSMMFNPDESIDLHGHTAPFIQYTFARITAILNKAKELDKQININFSISQIEKKELDIIVHLSYFSTILKQSAYDYSPAILTQYLYDLAKFYNSFYQEISIFNEINDNIVCFRIVLSKCTAQVIEKGMSLLGIQVPKRM